MLRQRIGAVFLLVAVAAGTAAATTAAQQEAQERPAPRLELHALQGQTIKLVHVGPRPDRLSVRHHDAIAGAERLYERQEFDEVITVLEPITADEPTNPFVLDLYARALFWAEQRPRSFAVYRDVVRLLDAAAEAPAGVVAVDARFIDAYWKLGILHLDRQEWQRAAFEISRVLATGAFEGRALEMALGYLTEAHFRLENYPAARYYANETLRRNPANDYVRPYLSRIPAL